MLEALTLPGLDTPCSRVSLGTMTFGAPVGQEEASAMVDRALDAGVTMFDTANIYTDGESERLLGRALAGRWDGVLVATKAHHRVGPGPDDAGLAPAALRRALESSLERLGTDRVDIFYFHQPDWDVPFEESLGAAQELVEAGKVGAVAVSNYPAWELARAAAAGELGRPTPHIHQVMYNLLARGLEDEYGAFAERTGMVQVVYNPLAGGLLTGRYADPADRPDSGRFTNDVYRNRYWHEPVFDAVRRLDTVAREAGLTTVELAFSWLRSRPIVDVVLLGASTLDQLEANLAAAALPPPDDDTLAACDEVWQRLRGPVPRYWR